MTQPLLIEIGVEELPAIPLLTIVSNIERSWENILKEYNLSNDFEFIYTPRRLVLKHAAMPLKQEDTSVEFFGPPVVAAMKDGGITVAWTSNGQDGSGDGIYAKYYLGDIIDPLQSFSLLSPANSSELEFGPVDFAWQTANSLPFNLNWDIEYRLYIDITSEMTNPDIYSNIFDTTYTIEMRQEDTDYYWRILARNNDNEQGLD